MSQSNSNTESKKSTSEAPCLLLHLSTGAVVICDVLASDTNVVLTRAPMELDVLFDEDGDVRDFMMRPYLYPFSFSKPDTAVTFSAAQICSVQQPHPLIQSYYIKSLNKAADSPMTNQTDLGPHIADEEDETPLEKTKQPETKAKVTLH